MKVAIVGTGTVGRVTARLTEAVLRNELIVVPVGTWHSSEGLTYSLPSVVGANGVEAVLEPALDDAERAALQRSIEALREAASHRT